jgi:hypothetical protein
MKKILAVIPTASYTNPASIAAELERIIADRESSRQYYPNIDRGELRSFIRLVSQSLVPGLLLDIARHSIFPGNLELGLLYEEGRDLIDGDFLDAEANIIWKSCLAGPMKVLFLSRLFVAGSKELTPERIRNQRSRVIFCCKEGPLVEYFLRTLYNAGAHCLTSEFVTGEMEAFDRLRDANLKVRLQSAMPLVKGFRENMIARQHSGEKPSLREASVWVYS